MYHYRTACHMQICVRHQHGYSGFRRSENSWDNVDYKSISSQLITPGSREVLSFWFVQRLRGTPVSSHSSASKTFIIYIGIWNIVRGDYLFMKFYNGGVGGGGGVSSHLDIL
jgi:hypothetical protein